MNRRTFKGNITHLNSNEIFVFGSNPEGKHGMGTAKIALIKFGAIYGQGRGLQGRSYGLITKNLRPGYAEKKLDGEIINYRKNGYRSVTKRQIVDNIIELYRTAENFKNYYFLVAYRANGTNLNGYNDIEMSEMFKEAGNEYGIIPINIVFEDMFYRYF